MINQATHVIDVLNADEDPERWRLNAEATHWVSDATGKVSERLPGPVVGWSTRHGNFRADGSMYGWLDPQGVFHCCGWAQHLEFASYVATATWGLSDKLKSVADQVLHIWGWFPVHGAKAYIIKDQEPSAAQYAWLLENNVLIEEP